MATTSATTTNPETQKLAGPGFWLSSIITTIGLIAVSWGSWVAFDTAFELASIDSFEVPGEQTRDLSASDYEVYVRTSTVSILELEIDDQDVSVDLVDVTVTNVDTGQELEVTSLLGTEPLGRSTSIFSPIAGFEVTEPGRYTVAIDSDQATRGLFGRPADSSMRASIPWAIMGAVGLILFIIGCVMLILGMVRRDRQKRERRMVQEWQSTTVPTSHSAAAPSTPPPPPPARASSGPATPAGPAPSPGSPPAPTPTSSSGTVDQPTVGRPSSHAPHVEPRQSETETPW